MDYKDYIEQAKKYLTNGNTDVYREYYLKAIDNINKQSDSSKKLIEDAYRNDLNTLSAQNANNKRSIAQYMASRGLARSGEAEQETINNNLSLNSAITELAGKKNSDLASLEKEKNDSLLALEKEYASSKDSINDRAMKIASEQMKSDEAKAQSELETERQKIDREYKEYLTRLQYELEEAKAEKEREYKDKVRKEEQAQSEKTADSGYKPSQTASSLAKDIVSSNAYNGQTIKSISDKVKVYNYIQSIKDTVSDSYLNDLKLSLSGLGYVEPTEKQRRLYGICNKSYDQYDSIYTKRFTVYEIMGVPITEAKKMAETEALTKQLDWILDQVKSEEEFEECLDMLYVSEEQRIKYNSQRKSKKSDSSDYIEKYYL